MGGRIAILLAFCCSLGNAEEIAVSKSDGNVSKPATETITIPLSEIWAMDMPGTKPMSRSMRAGKFKSEEGPLLEEIRWYKPSIREGFAVVGTGMEALENAYKVLVQNKEPKDLFTTGETLSIVFFTGSLTQYIYLHDVNRNGNQIVVRYKLVFHQSLNMSKHLALIPLQDLPTGKYDVVIERLPLDKQYVEAGLKDPPAGAEGLVSKSFSFRLCAEPLQ